MRFRRRLILLYVAFGVGLAVVWLRTVQMQTVDGAYWAERAKRARQIVRVAGGAARSDAGRRGDCPGPRRGDASTGARAGGPSNVVGASSAMPADD